MSNLRQAINRRMWLVVGALTALSLAARLWRLGAIRARIFDEMYFVTFAQDYLSSTHFFDIHPPLGKLLLALGISICGDGPLGWRIMPALFGTALIPLTYLTGKELRGKAVGFLAALILALDGMTLVYSRAGLLDIFLVFFIMLSLYAFLRFADSSKPGWLALAGAAFGLAASVKYVAVVLVLVLILAGWARKVPFRDRAWQFIAFLAVVPAVIYVSLFVFNFGVGPGFWHKWLQWHEQTLNYNLHLEAEHSYGSRWWSWFLLLRPLWLHFHPTRHIVVGVDGLGNPLAWWSALIVVPLLAWGALRRDKVNLILLGGFWIFLAPWIVAPRVTFIYHALPSFTFLVFGIAIWLRRIAGNPLGKIIIGLYLVGLVAMFVYFWPIWTGVPLTPEELDQRLWFSSWL